MERLKATYRITTPMFLTRDRSTAELRAASFKGALRFWYRAIALPRLGEWSKVKEAEKRIFGSADKDKGQAGFLLHLEPPSLETGREMEKWRDRPGSAYLGYGCITKQVETQRAYILPDQEFTATLTLRPDPHRHSRLAEEDVADLKRSLIALGLFGGLGGRSRRGFGSISLDRLQVGGEEIWAPPPDLQSLEKAIAAFIHGLGSLPEGLPEYTAFSRLARVVVVPAPVPPPPDADPAGNGTRLLDEVGAELIGYRSNGRQKPNGSRQTAVGLPPETTFAPDHDLMAAFANRGVPPADPPKRVVFGLPHNYHFSSGADAWITGASSERRASPLLIHIHALGGTAGSPAQHAAVLTYLPARFLPADEPIQLKRSKGQTVPVSATPDWSVMTKLLDRYQTKWKGVRPL